MNEFDVLSDYLKGETFYYYYSPENKILDAIWGFGGHKKNGVPWTARRTKEEAELDQQKHLVRLKEAKSRLEYFIDLEREEKSKIRFCNEKQDWHPLEGVLEMVELIRESTENQNRTGSQLLAKFSDESIINEVKRRFERK